METSSRRKSCDTCFEKKLRTTSIRRKAASKKPVETNPTAEESSGSNQSLDERLARIEAKLDDLRSLGSGITLNEIVTSSPINGNGRVALDVYTPPSDLSSQNASGPGQAFDIPPLLDVLPIVDSYFRHFNTAVPLYHQPSFMKMLNEFYACPSRKLGVEWAAINIVLANGYIARSIAGDDIALDFDDSKVSKCIANARKQLDAATSRNHDLLGIQELSLRLRTPSFQLDSDVDIDLPRAEPDELDGSIESLDGLSRFNYFRARVLLAHISGKIYDELFSHRSKKLSPQTRQQRVVGLDRILDKWQRSIPAPLHPEHLGQTLGMVPGSLMVMLHGVYSLESPWIKRLGGFTNTVLQHAANNSEVCLKHQAPPLPSAWAKIVSTSRGCLQLYVSGLNGASKIWPDACSNFTAFVILLANIVYHPLHEVVEHDRRLVRDAIKLREKQLDFDGLEWFRKLQVILASLDRLVEVTVNFARTNGRSDLPPEVASTLDKPYPAIQLEGFGADDIEHAFNVDSYAHTSLPAWLGESTFGSHDLGLRVPDMFPVEERVGSTFMEWDT
ncbi:hypothetical protein DL764_007231 [Monosporascus ibericus]|uniref:Transcription factor domain-containing protein n=1 Tax=Monosporascus ibericus TaxID=155417 RepID=A0A4Q4T2M4_9PEZI|nr:hypothetical protein DL764_007231 [Monosporascus ibericus]